MIPTQDEIIELVGMIWTTALGLEVVPVGAANTDEWALPAVEAQVHITGTWRGVVVLHTSQALAARVAQRMFDLGDTAPTLEDVQDAFGEIANITGGNIKGLLSEGNAHLSLPAVVQGLNYSVSVPGSQQIARVEFLCGGEPLVVTVLKAQPRAGHSVSRLAERRRDPDAVPS